MDDRAAEHAQQIPPAPLLSRPVQGTAWVETGMHLREKSKVPSEKIAHTTDGGRGGGAGVLLRRNVSRLVQHEG